MSRQQFAKLGKPRLALGIIGARVGTHPSQESDPCIDVAGIRIDPAHQSFACKLVGQIGQGRQ